MTLILVCSFVIWSPSVVASLHFISIALLPSKQSISNVLGLCPKVFGIFVVAESGNFSKKHNFVASSKNEPAYLYKNRPLF